MIAYDQADLARAIFSEIGDALFLLDPDTDRLLEANPVALRMTGFTRDELLDAYEADTQRGEAVYDTHLRRFLFGEGFSMPFSQARSPSGDSDVVTHLEDEPLVCEVKLFDGDRKNKHHVATGVHQALLYAQDYGQSAAHLVIINLSGRPIELPTDGKGDSGLPYLDLSGVRIHFVPVRARRLASASKLGRAEPFVFTRGDLVEPD